MQQLQQPQMQQLQKQQRVNFCTICNKELCNKYFMKTHMLKMHGINLKLDNKAECCTQQSESAKQSAPVDVEKTSQSLAPADRDRKRDKYDLTRQVTGTKRKLKTNGTISVKNGFAGNSMGGVVCDICNKELCSKYFLKVHKQNTHGIATDYQDLSRQLLLPFYAAQQQQQQQQNQQQQQLQQQHLVMHSAISPTSILQQNHQLARLPPTGPYSFTSPVTCVPPDHRTVPANNGSPNCNNSNTRLNAHYTEACPMCDRKFKSIKWLKTHMLNNHKDEIQYFLANLVQATNARDNNKSMMALNQHHRLY